MQNKLVIVEVNLILDKAYRLQLSETMKMMQETYNSAVGNLNDDDEIDCPICMNRGSSMEIRWIGDIPYEVAVLCPCTEERKTKKAVEKSGLSPLMKKNFDNYRITEPWQKNIKNSAFKNVSALEWFFIGGQSGAGKTHICSAICNSLLKQGFKVRYSIWTRDFRELNYMADKRDEYNHKIRELKEIEVLYIDDLFKHKKGGQLSNADTTLVFEVLNYRNLHNKKTIISSEYNINEIAEIDEAVAGRITEKAGAYVWRIGKDIGKNMRLASRDGEVM